MLVLVNYFILTFVELMQIYQTKFKNYVKLVKLN